MNPNIACIVGNITEQEVDAIVNAANNLLLRGGGVDGAIHAAAGPELQTECFSLGTCETGASKITAGYRLPSKHVIHTVGPMYGRTEGRDAEVLTSCYWSALQLAKEHNLSSIAFPAISTGVYGYPKEEAATIAVNTVRKFLEGYDMQVRFVLFSADDAAHYRVLL